MTTCCEHHQLACDQGRKCPLRTKDGGESVNGDIAFPLHRQVMPPEPDSDAGYWWMFGIAAAAIVCFVLAVVHFAKYQF